MATEKLLIRGDVAEQRLSKLAEHYKGSFSGEAFERAAREIANLPRVYAVEVVRCKDCKHYLWHDWDYSYCCIKLNKFVKQDFGCLYGERKDKD